MRPVRESGIEIRSVAQKHERHHRGDANCRPWIGRALLPDRLYAGKHLAQTPSFEVKGFEVTTVDEDVPKLQRDLSETREYLRNLTEQYEAHSEELRASNEEARSANEELQSTNEELRTTKEELQSANEELTTVNEELQSRNQELNATNSDLKNLLSCDHDPHSDGGFRSSCAALQYRCRITLRAWTRRYRQACRTYQRTYRNAAA